MKLLLLLILVSCTGAPHYKGPVTNHFNGDTFENRIPQTKGFFSYWYMRLTTSRSDWPEWVKSKAQKIPQNLLSKDVVSATFINHSTFLLNIGGIKILTDPIYSKRASPFDWIGPKRVIQPGVRFEDLPSIDLVLISHNHYDHLDIDTLKKLSKKHNPLFIVGLGNSLLLKEHGITNVKEMDWDQSFSFNDLLIRFVYCQHWSGRGLFDRRKTLWGSFVIESPHTKIYFAGDTGYSSHFKEQGELYGPFDLALIPIGSYEARSFMKFSHVNPEEAVIAHLDLKSKKTMGIHFGTFQLTNESRQAPIDELRKARLQYSVKENVFFHPQFGKTYLVKNLKKE